MKLTLQVIVDVKGEYTYRPPLAGDPAEDEWVAEGDADEAFHQACLEAAREEHARWRSETAR